METKAKKNVLVLLIGIGLILLLIGGFLGCCHKRQDSNTLQSTRQMLEKEIPEGTRAEKVELFFAQKKWEHSFDPNLKSFYARFPDTERSDFIIKADISIIVQLDSENRVMQIIVNEFLTGP